MMKVAIYKAKGKHYAFRTTGSGALAGEMGTVVFTVEHEDATTATELARFEAKKKGLTVEGL